jgi:hypothetical protein
MKTDEDSLQWYFGMYQLINDELVIIIELRERFFWLIFETKQMFSKTRWLQVRSHRIHSVQAIMRFSIHI